MTIGMTLKKMKTSGKSIEEEFKTLGIGISESTAQRRLKNADLQYTKPLFRERMGSEAASGVDNVHEKLQLEPDDGD